MRASGDPYLQHCVETAVLLASIGANSAVVAAGLLHDTIDDSCLSYEYICRTFGAAVADLVEGVRHEFPLSNALLMFILTKMLFTVRFALSGIEIFGIFNC